MKNIFRKIFNMFKGKPNEQEFTDKEYEDDYELKLKGLENVLGEMSNTVGHAIIPFKVGGAVDMYYFPKHISGTGFATMELLEPDGTGPKPNSFGTYELVAFTKHPYFLTEDERAPFNLIERRICGILTTTGFYSYEAVLSPGETCEVPNDGEENICIILDNYKPDNKVFSIGKRKHHLLLCMEIFKTEMIFAIENGSKVLFEKLKAAGYYPYSDMDRAPVE